ncbi:MAG: DUF2130 domain-containing protein [Clostridia bacterium]
MRNENIKCSNCGYEIPVEYALMKQAETKMKLEYDKKYEEQARIFKKQKEQLEKDKSAFEEQKANTGMQPEEKGLKEAEDKIRQLELEKQKALTEVEKMKQQESALVEKEKELADRQEEAEIQVQKRLLEEIGRVEEEASKKERGRYDLLIKEYEKKISDQKKQIEEMKTNAKQEPVRAYKPLSALAVGDLLKAAFPDDDIKPVDDKTTDLVLLQIVKNNRKQPCGNIVFRIGQAKDFSGDWVNQLKADRENVNASFSVMVTEVFPDDIDGFGCMDDIWICGHQEIRNLAFIFREMLMREHAVLQSTTSKDEKGKKMDSYLSSEEFRDRVEGIVSGFSSLKEQISKEKHAMQNLWTQREKQIEMAVENTIGMYGSIKGIGGEKIHDIPLLEFPSDPDEDNKKKG